MSVRFVTQNIHAYLDYPVAVALMALPVVLNLGQTSPLAFWLSVGTGIAAFILTLLTDHQLGVFRVISYKLHLAVDLAVGLLFVAAPVLFSFGGLDAAYYWLNGAAVLVVVSLHKPERDFVTV